MDESQLAIGQIIGNTLLVLYNIHKLINEHPERSRELNEISNRVIDNALISINAILAARVPNSLKLLNLKRILEALLDNERADKETTELIFQAIDDLLIQL